MVFQVQDQSKQSEAATNNIAASELNKRKPEHCESFFRVTTITFE